MSASPIIQDMPEEGISTATMDGAYHLIRGDAVQIIIIGVMHFTPGEYIDAANELLDSHYDLMSTQFMTYRPNDRKEVLRRGFVNLIGIKRD